VKVVVSSEPSFTVLLELSVSYSVVVLSELEVSDSVVVSSEAIVSSVVNSLGCVLVDGNQVYIKINRNIHYFKKFKLPM
jgi:hypothetical protein